MQEGSAVLGFLLPTGAVARRQRSCLGSRCSPCCTERSACRRGFRGGSKAQGLASPRGSAAGDPRGCQLLPVPRGRAELEEALGTAPCREHGQLLAQLLAACVHPSMPNPGQESRFAGKNTGVRAQSHSWLCHSLSPNIWSRILLSRETNLASGEQLAQRLN